ncbi:MAG TPA: ASCH domain-containing protein [Galbitalea sp.]|jgi:uncharacterized protein YhfF|nr:ASCH domain-containing protein [Galbitalea sp.]
MNDASSLPIAEFGFPGPLRDQLVAAILERTKTSTTARVSDYEFDNEALPAVGDRRAVVDSDGRRVAIIETTAVAIARVADVDVQHAIDEGEGYVTVAGWRAAHVEFWDSAEMHEYLGEANAAVTDDTELVLERFRMVELL